VLTIRRVDRRHTPAPPLAAMWSKDSTAMRIWAGFPFPSSRAPQPPAAPTAPPAALKRESAHQARRRAKPIGAEMIALSVTIPSAFEEIDWMVRNIEHAALIVAGFLALACVACEWRA
jgi:hypothetical protein